jgi:hypothetical protein
MNTVIKFTNKTMEIPGDGTLIRPLFSPGLLLQDSDLTQIVDYQQSKTALLLRSLLGCGVLCGFQVKPETNLSKCGALNMTIDAGVALDCQGNLLEMPLSLSLVIDPGCDKELSLPLWISIAVQGRNCASRDLLCTEEAGVSLQAPTRFKEGFKLIIDNQQPNCACSNQAADNGSCGTGCQCQSVLLAKIDHEHKKEGQTEPAKITADHSVRRYIRPVFADPLAKPKEPAGSDKQTDETNSSSTTATPSTPGSQATGVAESAVSTVASDSKPAAEAK